jgi:hypothetical protein
MNPIAKYALVERAWPHRLRGPGNSQSATNGLLYISPSYRQNSAADQASGSAIPGPGVELGYFSLHNRAGTTQMAGMAVRIPNNLWVAGKWSAASTTYIDDTTDAQSTATTDFPLETAAVNNDGFVVASVVPFNAMSFDIVTANGGAGATRAMFRSDRAGAAWTTVAANASYVTLPAVIPVTGTNPANEGLVVFDVAEDWGAVTASTNANWTGMPLNMYAINIRATTAPTAAAVANSLSIYRMYWVTEGLADNGTFEVALGAMCARPEFQGDALVPLFSTADEGNRVTVLVGMNG